ncbi:MAG: hypothetical protein NTV01_06310 [Bacteroidia bacterium]|nr:hypothetical protein [Bacteroidia bacterium]
MASYLSQIISNTFGLSGAGQIQPEIQNWQHPGVNTGEDPFVEHETVMTRPDFSGNDSNETRENINRTSKVNRNESPLQDITAATIENAEHGISLSGKVTEKQEYKPPDQEKAFQPEPEARAIISTDITSGISEAPVKDRAVRAEPVSRKESQGISPVNLHTPLARTSPIGVPKEEPAHSSPKENQVIKSDEGIIFRDGVLPDMLIKRVEPDISSRPFFQQQPKQQFVERGSRDILPNEPVTNITAISTKRETRLVIGKLTVEVVQQAKEKNIPVPPPVMVNNKPSLSGQRRNEGGSTIKIKFGLGQL